MCFQTHSKHIALISIIRNICHLFPPLVFHQTFFWYQGKHQWMFLLFCFSRHWCKPCRVNGYRVRKVDIANQCDKVQNLDVTRFFPSSHALYFSVLWLFLALIICYIMKFMNFQCNLIACQVCKETGRFMIPILPYDILFIFNNAPNWKWTSSFCSQMEKNIKLLLLLDEISFLNLTIIIFQFLDASSKIQMK